MSSADFKNVSLYIDSHNSEAVQLMKNLISIKALSPLNNGDGEVEKAEFIKDYLKAIGIKNIEEYPASDPKVKGGLRPNLIARLNGKSDKTIWILTHMDVVPEGDLSKWDSNPFEAVVKDGKIFGRGTEDNHQGLVSSIIAAKAFLETNTIPEHNIALLFVADEETGSKYGLQYLVDNHGEMFSENDIYIVPDAGEADGAMIEVAEKSILWVKFKTIGKQVHASLPDKGINAFRAASNLVVALDELHVLYSGKNNVFDPPVSTFEPTRKDANVPNINTIPGEDIFYLDCRILPRYKLGNVIKDIDKICKIIENKFGVKIIYSFEQEEQAAPATSAESPVVRALKAAIKDVMKIEARPLGIGGGTVAAIFRRLGLDVAVWSTIDDVAHQPNEYCHIENIINDAKVFAHICLQKL